MTREYLGLNQYYPKVELGIGTLSKNVSTWGVRLMPSQESLIEFHFMKNDNEDSIKKMPIHALKVWVHKLTTVVFMFENPRRKHVVGLVCLIDKINDGFSLTRVKKGFWFKELKDKTTQDNRDLWDEFFEVFQIEKDELARDS